MGQFLNIDNKFFQSIGKLVDCVCLSMLWFFLSIFIIPAGAATTALYYAVNKVIRNGRGYMGKEFWHAFRTNFKQSTIVWLIVLAIYALMGSDAYITYQYAVAGEKIGTLYIVFFILMLFVTMWVNYLFPYIARFENTTKVILKNTLIISLANLGWTVLMFLILAIMVYAIYILPFLVFILPAIYMWIISVFMEKIFRKYMTPEDIEAEDERNREYYN